MARLFSLFAILALALSLTVGSVSHAQSSIACVDIAQTVDGDAGDSDVPGDCKKGCLHHASCHGHHVMATSGNFASASSAIAEARPFPRSEAALAGASTDPAIRPPQA